MCSFCGRSHIWYARLSMASRRGPGTRDFRLVAGKFGSRLQKRSIFLLAWEVAASPGSARAVYKTRGLLSPGGDRDQQLLSRKRHRARAHALPERGGEFAGFAGRVVAGSAHFFRSRSRLKFWVIVIARLSHQAG